MGLALTVERTNRTAKELRSPQLCLAVHIVFPILLWLDSSINNVVYKVTLGMNLLSQTIGFFREFKVHVFTSIPNDKAQVLRSFLGKRDDTQALATCKSSYAVFPNRRGITLALCRIPRRPSTDIKRRCHRTKICYWN